MKSSLKRNVSMLQGIISDYSWEVIPSPVSQEEEKSSLTVTEAIVHLALSRSTVATGHMPWFRVKFVPAAQ